MVDVGKYTNPRGAMGMTTPEINSDSAVFVYMFFQELELEFLWYSYIVLL